MAHSRSPIIHDYWLKEHGIAGCYDKRPVEPRDLTVSVRTMRGEGYVGGNVTIPHKQAIVAICDRTTPAAARLNSVNTLWFEGETLCGDSTDGLGFVAALDQEAPGWDVKKDLAIVLGAGGAARAVVDAIMRRGFEDVLIASRTRSRSMALARQLDCLWTESSPIPDVLASASLLVNTTPAGMAGEAPLDLDLAGLPANAVVDDIVYVPRETPLLRAARERGLRTVGGLGMLLHQAVPGFERWFGVRPTVTAELRALIEADIARSARLAP